MTEITIHPLGKNEIDILVKLARNIWHAHYPGMISSEQIDYMLNQRYNRAAIAESLDSQHWDAAWANNKMVAFANSFADDPSKAWKLDKLYVHPQYQRKGIGRLLLETVRKHAKEAAASRLTLRVNKRNAIALSAYEKYGFRIYGEHVLDIGNGFMMDDYLLELNLCS